MKSPIRISLLVDDGAPVNLMAFHDPPHDHPFLIPNSLAREFAGLCETYGVRGKFSVVPMPGCLGGIDDRLRGVPPRHLARFLDIVRERIAPRFDITPEVLTHLAAYRIAEGGFRHVYEDEWVARASESEMTDYFALAFEMLDRVGLPATGMTSPWNTGQGNESSYARAIGAAQWLVHRRRVTWYFLHVAARGSVPRPAVRHRNRRNGQTVVSIPAVTDDPFWNTQRPMSPTCRAARAAARAGVDALLGKGGRSGRVAEVVRAGAPVTILTHWPSLFSDGTRAGLWGLERLLERLHQAYGSRLAWTTCAELARQTAVAVGEDAPR